MGLILAGLGPTPDISAISLFLLPYLPLIYIGPLDWFTQSFSVRISWMMHQFFRLGFPKISISFLKSPPVLSSTVNIVSVRLNWYYHQINVCRQIQQRLKTNIFGFRLFCFFVFFLFFSLIFFLQLYSWRHCYFSLLNVYFFYLGL